MIRMNLTNYKRDNELLQFTEIFNNGFWWNKKKRAADDLMRTAK